MTHKLAPEENIAPAYMAFGAVLLLVFVAIVGTILFAVATGLTLEPLVVKLLAALAILNFIGFLLFVLRPRRFDALFRSVVSSLPFFKYGSTPPTGGTSS